jgi:hypothetical protein
MQLIQRLRQTLAGSRLETVSRQQFPENFFLYKQ